MARPKRPQFNPKLADHRHLHGLTQEKVAEHLGLSVEMIRRHEHGLAYPSPSSRAKYVALYGAPEVSLGLSTIPTTTSSSELASSQLSPSLAVAFRPDVRLDTAALDGIRGYIRQLVALDNQFGGTELAPLAGRFFRSIHHQIGAGLYEPSIRSDLISIAGELAEVVGWLAYDADRQDLVRRMNQESLYFTRLVGDASIELLTLQNASMHAGFLGKPAEALGIAESVLEGNRKLSSRIRCLFLVRKARALAQGGSNVGLNLIREARSLHQDGVTNGDPAWAWWIDEREISWHEAMCKADLHDPQGALDSFERSVEATPPGETRSQYLHRAHLFEAQVRLNCWNDAEKTLGDLSSLALQVSSNRTVKIIRRSLGSAKSAPESLSDAGAQLISFTHDDSIV